MDLDNDSQMTNMHYIAKELREGEHMEMWATVRSNQRKISHGHVSIRVSTVALRNLFHRTP